MASPAELSLDYKPNSTYTIIQKPQEEQPDPHTQKIQDFLARLEEELHKIEAFKRELPLCMQLLNNAIEIYKQKLEKYQTSQVPRSVLEEFMPLKHMNTDGSEKANWMVSAQLWSPPNNEAAKQQAAAAPPPPKEPEHGFDMTSKLALDTKQRNGGAFLPFSKEKNKAVRIAPRALPELALTSSEKVIEEKKCAELENGGANARGENGTASDRGAEHGKGGSSNTTEGQAAAAAAPTNRKARRCWSPDLHRRFVNALQILGGSQVATPKQIRELMKVDGLTNDEVKSHLQKYRLHTRRPAPVPHAAAVAAAPRLVVLGGIWVPPEYATSAAAGPAIYGAHAASAHYCTAATPVPQEFYPPPLPPVPHHHHHHHLHSPLDLAPAAAAYKGRAAGSPESEVRSGGERSESIEEEEEGEERVEEEEEAEEKALVPLQAEDGNGGDVALKF